MSITIMCGKTDVGAVLDKNWSQPDREVYTKTVHAGLVLSTRERNMHDDSDFLATVWNPETKSPVEIEYGTTRFWSYPNCATVDATPEVRAAYDAWRLNESYKACLREDIDLSKAPAKGKTCIVVKGRKIKKGQTVVCIGEPKSSFFHRTETVNILVKCEDGSMVHTNVENLEVQGSGQYLHTDAENHDKAARRLAVYGDGSRWTASEGKLIARAMAR